ncbi:MAG: PAS domain S-box protein, partial [Flavisolibacter sp.]
MSSLIALGFLFYRNNQAFKTGTTLVTHTSNVISRTDSISLFSLNLQWESRNYTLTGDSNAYRKYFSIRDSLQSSVAYFIGLVDDHKLQYANAITLQRQVIDLIHFTDGSLSLRQALRDTMDHFIANVEKHIMLYGAINQQIRLIKIEENRLLALQRANVYETIDVINRIVVALAILILLLLIGTFMFVFYHFKKRQKAEKKLIESEGRFQTLLNSTRDLAIFMIDDKGNILDWYEGAQNIKGYHKEEVIGRNISIFYTPESITEDQPQRHLQLAAEQGSLKTEGWRMHKNGSRFWADVLITAVFEDGKLKGFTNVTRDFSLQKKAKDDINILLQKEIELNHLKSNFVTLASHEFRTPLSTILSSISLIEKYKTTETQDNRDKHINRIKSALNELVATLEEFLSLEKIEDGKVHVKKEVFNIKELAEQTIGKFNTALKPGQEISYYHSGKEKVCLDSEFVNHILNNFISNSIKYSPESTEIIFETIVNETTTTLKIKDRGIGISTDDQKH